MKKSKHSSMYLIISLIFVGILLLWSLGSWLVVRNIEEPSYTLVERGDGYELRDYAPYIVAEVEVSGNRDQSMRQGFRLLADYIFGNNTKSTPIAMTAPVAESVSEPVAMTVPVMEQGSGDTRRVTFSMPSKYTLETLPKPNNSAVTLREIPAHRVAVRRFSWYATDSRITRLETELIAALQRDGLTPLSSPAYAGY
ncbi:heme-binding protein, partial [Candidatus Gracilibacteria bacterium]|nr:heme-binding protein [Candidatus Gracilibacteria bacterium]